MKKKIKERTDIFSNKRKTIKIESDIGRDSSYDYVIFFGFSCKIIKRK